MAILTHPTDEDLTAFVRAYDLGALRRARGIEAGTVNTSYALELDAGAFFLRIYEEQDARGAAREARVLAHLAAHDVPTPAPLEARDGAATRTVAGKPAALFPWVAGEMLCQRAVTPEAGAAIGQALARLHRAGHAPDAALDAGRFGPLELARRCERVAASDDVDARACAGALRDAVEAFATRRRRDLPSGLVHGDLFRDNVLWAPPSEGPHPSAPQEGKSEYRISALLDFESAHDGPFAYDLAVILLSWCYGSTFDPALASAIVRGYRSVRELERSEREALFDEAIFAALRFTITRITDNAIRVGKRWQRFVARRAAIEQLGPRGFQEMLGL